MSDVSIKTISTGENDKFSSVEEIAQEEGNIFGVCPYCFDNYK